VHVQFAVGYIGIGTKWQISKYLVKNDAKFRKS
jgi:hypothetical protein